jgi:hypothetical protein
MLPKTLLHKRNGHSHPPQQSQSPGDMLRLVHGARKDATPPTFDLLRFAQVVQAEKAAAVLAEAAKEVDGFQVALGVALADTDAAFARGELADVRRILEAFRAEAEAVNRTVGALVAAAMTRARERQLVDVNHVVARMLAVVRHRIGDAVAVRHHADAALPPVAGDPEALERMIVALATAPWPARAGGAGALTVETLRVTGALRGEDVVRVRLLAEGEGLAEPAATVLAEASDVAQTHGGVFVVAILPGGGRRYTIELPGV